MCVCVCVCVWWKRKQAVYMNSHFMLDSQFHSNSGSGRVRNFSCLELLNKYKFFFYD